jgi:hypothetical protein
MDDILEPERGNSYSAALGEHANNPSQPRQVGVPLVLNGKEYTLATDEARIKAQFEAWMKGRALRVIAEMAKVDADEADSLRSTFMVDVAAGAYAYDGRVGRAARKDWDGNIYLFWLMLRRCDPKVTLTEADELLTDYPKEVGLAMRQAQGNWPSSLAKTKRERARGQSKETTGTEMTMEDMA